MVGTAIAFYAGGDPVFWKTVVDFWDCTAKAVNARASQIQAQYLVRLKWQYCQVHGVMKLQYNQGASSDGAVFFSSSLLRPSVAF